MFFTSLYRLITFAARDFVRNIWLSATTIVILTLTLVSFQALIAVNLIGSAAVQELESRLDFRIQFRPTVSESDVDAVRLQFKDRPEISTVEQHSRAQVLADFQTTHRANEAVTGALEELGDNPFGPELRVHLRQPEDFPVVKKLVDDSALAKLVVDAGATEQVALSARLTALTSRIRFGVGVVSAVFLAITLLIIMNAMRIATYARREEAAIMKLVGAPNWFIRTPFLIMGIIASAIAAVLAQALTIPAMAALRSSFVALLGPRGVDIANFFQYHVWTIGALEFLGLAVLTVIVSGLAIRRYLKV